MKNGDTNTIIAAERLRHAGARGAAILIAAMSLTMARVASAQQPLRFRVGVLGHIALSSHVAGFERIPGTESCCLGFTGGKGTGFAAGALAELPLGDAFLLGGRLTFLTHPFSMTTPEGTYVIVNGVGTPGTFEHHLDGSIATLGLEPMLGFRPFGSFIISAGARIALPVSTRYEQREQLTQPSGLGTFISADGTDSHMRTRNEFSGALPSPEMQVAPMVAASYELPINASGTLLLAPEVSYQFGATNAIAGVDWRINTLRAGIALKYSPAPAKPEMRERRERVDTVRVVAAAGGARFARGIETFSETRDAGDEVTLITETMRRTDTLFTEPAKPKLAAMVNAVGVEANGAELPLLRLRVEEFSSTLMAPLLHYVFFDENSSDIPARYVALGSGEADRFSIDAVNSPDRLPTYHQLLNIVGRRMRDNAKATITLTGCNEDIRDEKGNADLSRRRAEGVKRYLVETWGIDEKRIALESGNLPAMAANTLTADGSEENRRVEITSNDPRILEPVVTNDTLRRANPPGLRFRTGATADAGIARWRLIAEQDGRVLHIAEGRDSLPSVHDWSFDREQGSVPHADSDINYTLAVTDATGATTESSGRIPVELVTIRKKRIEQKGDKEIDRFSLILFDVRSAALLPSHEPIIALIKRYFHPASTATVTGYTDRLGQTRYNQQLAENRAAAVARALGHGSAGATGVAQADLFDSSLPEGRLYTRTVDVVIETPIEADGAGGEAAHH
jgi:outer membrane protein OmpA-like peptidoglycan-associated protein